jgi:hypothetical protein
MPEPGLAARLDHLDRVAHNMDRALRIPLIGVRVGLDSILGLVPGVGDLLALGPAGVLGNDLIITEKMDCENTTRHGTG